VPDPRPDARRALTDCPLLKGLSPSLLDEISARMQIDIVERGALLMAEGDVADAFGVVVSGKIHVSHLKANGRRVTLETLGRADAFGSIAVLAGGRNPAHVEAATPATVTWIPREIFLEALDAEPSAGRLVIQTLSLNLLNLTDVVQKLALNIPARLARYLFERSLASGRPTAEGLEVALDMSKTELASALGTVPETLSRALGRLRDDGVLEVRSDTVIVFDVGALAKMGSGYEEG